MLSTFLLNRAAELLGKKWRFTILYNLKDGPLRFSEIKNKLPGCSVKVLSEVLREMQGNRLVIRNQYNTIPVKVTYKISPDLEPMLSITDTHMRALSQFALKQPATFNVPKELLAELIKYASCALLVFV